MGHSRTTSHLLKSLSVSPAEEPDDQGYLYEYMTRNYASSIAASARDIMLFQLHSLEHVSIHGIRLCYGLDFFYISYEHRMCDSYYYLNRMDHRRFGQKNVCIPEYCSLLSTLTDLLRQPQLQSVSVGGSPTKGTENLSAKTS